MMAFGWADGEWVSPGERVLQVGDPGALLGQGVFETFRLKSQGVSAFSQHLARLGWAALRQNCAPVPQIPFEQILQDLLQKSGLKEARARITLRPPGVNPRLLLQVLPLGSETERMRREGVSLEISPFLRSAKDPTVAIKLVSRGFLDRAKALAKSEGADDALLLGEDFQVLETTTANFFLVDSLGRLSTTTLCDAFLPGITRNRVLRLAQGLGWDLGSNWIQREDLWTAREAFVTNAVMGVAPVRKIGSRDFPLGPKALHLQRILDD